MVRKGQSGLLGIEVVSRNLNQQVMRIKNRSVAGLVKAAIVIRRDMDSTVPLIPIDTGNLRASWFITSSKGIPVRGSGKGGHAQVVAGAAGRARAFLHPVVIMGFSANYSVFVHEMDFKEGKRPGSGPKFFESSLKRNSNIILQIIANEIKF